MQDDEFRMVIHDYDKGRTILDTMVISSEDLTATEVRLNYSDGSTEIIHILPGWGYRCYAEINVPIDETKTC